MKSNQRSSVMVARLLVGVAAVYAAAGTARPALGDDDDKKLLDKKSAVVGPIVSGPDPWKLLRRTLTAGQLGQGDETFPSRNIALKGWMPLNNFTGFPGAASANGADCWGYTSPSGREYALMGLSWGNGIVEVTDPANPTLITVIPGGVNILWRDITVIGQYAYAVSDSAGVGIQVMNLANIDAGQVQHVVNYMQGGHTTTHTILSNPASGFLYLCGGNAAGGGMIPASTTNPTSPAFTGPGWTTSYVHEALIESYTSGPYAGKEIAFVFRGNSNNRLSIIDITNKQAPVTLSSISYPGANYSHQGWLSPDKKYLYHNDEIDGPGQDVPRMLTRVFDVSDLSTPRLVSTFTNGTTSVDHNEYTQGRYLYQSNYTSGLRVWDTSDPLKPVEVAYIDTRPEDDGTGYNGAWGNYPYFSSGTILISDLERGLFTVKLSLLELSLPSAAPAVLTPGQPTPVSVSVGEREATIGDVSVMVSVNNGTYSAYPMTSAGGGLYTGSIPAASCNDRVRYFFRAETSEANPRAFTWPLTAATGDVFTAYAQDSQTVIFSDNFQTDTGWTVQNSATAGGWVRGVPLYNGGPGAVIGDADGSGACFVTGNTLNADVDGGPTYLTSPTLNLSAAPEARISFARWFLSIRGVTDTLTTEISNNNGATWTQVEALGPVSGGWKTLTFRVADYVTPTAQVRVRFGTADGDVSTTEAGIDAFTVVSPVCAAPCYANCDGSTITPVLNVNDFICFQNLYASGNPSANCDGSTIAPVLNVNDFICFQNLYAQGCP